MAAIFVACVLLTVTLDPVASSVVMSIEKLRDLAAMGDNFLTGIAEQVANLPRDEIRKLTNLSRGPYRGAVPVSQYNLNHPNDIYLLVKYYTNTWDALRSDNPTLEAAIPAASSLLPTQTDLAEARASLLRLQVVYQLKVKDMMNGYYMGYRGFPLDAEDAYLVGREGFQGGVLSQAEDWLEQSVAMLTGAPGGPPTVLGHAPHVLPSSKQTKDRNLLLLLLKARALLGRVSYYRNNTQKATELLQLCKSSPETDPDVKELDYELGLPDRQAKIKSFGHDAGFPPDYSTLCSRDKDHRVTVTRPYHVCRYKPDAFVPYLRFQEEILATLPYASVFYDVIYDPEIEHLKDLAKQRMSRALLAEDGVLSHSKQRTGQLAWVPDRDSAVASRVSQRVKAFTRLEVKQRYDDQSTPTSAEDMQVVNYGLGGHYDYHTDATRSTEGVYAILEDTRNRITTVLLYLTDVERGGGTVFPHVGVSVAPKKGMALVWYNLEPDMNDVDSNTLHAGCPVLIGNKWIANKWIHVYGNTFRQPCGAKPNSRQLDIEKVVTMSALKESP